MRIVEYDKRYLVTDNYNKVIYEANTHAKAALWIKNRYEKLTSSKYERLKLVVTGLIEKGHKKNAGSTIQFSWHNELIKIMQEIEPDEDWSY